MNSTRNKTSVQSAFCQRTFQFYCKNVRYPQKSLFELSIQGLFVEIRLQRSARMRRSQDLFHQSLQKEPFWISFVDLDFNGVTTHFLVELSVFQKASGLEMAAFVLVLFLNLLL